MTAQKALKYVDCWNQIHYCILIVHKSLCIGDIVNIWDQPCIAIMSCFSRWMTTRRSWEKKIERTTIYEWFGGQIIACIHFLVSGPNINSTSRLLSNTIRSTTYPRHPNRLVMLSNQLVVANLLAEMLHLASDRLRVIWYDILEHANWKCYT